MSVALIVLVTGTLAAAALDLRYRRIPNALTAAMAVAAIALHLVDGTTAVLLVLAAMTASFALGSLAFSAGWFGGGDVKLVTAACGLVSYPGCVWLVLSILIAGAVLALVQAAGQRRLAPFIRNASALALTGSVPQTPTLLPYGVAIAGGSTAYAVSTLLPLIRLPL
jgi:prepilin peptidase CpaA